jgi:hypothetical protein
MHRNQCLIAVFDDWDALTRVLGELGGKEWDHTAAVLHKRRDEPAGETASWLLQDTTELRFAASVEHVHCTTGNLARELAARSAGGAHSLAEALRGWLTSEQARELEWHIERGRLVLWLRPAASEDFGAVSARLIKASPHLVGLCTIELNP